MTQKEEISAVTSSIREAINQLASQTNIPFILGSAQGGAIKLYEYCTFTAPGQEPLILGVTLWNKDGKLELTLELTEESSGYSHWRVCLNEPTEGGVSKLAELAISNLPKVTVIQKILLPPPKPEPEDQKKILTSIVKLIRHGEVNVEKGVELVEGALNVIVRKNLASQAKSLVDYLSKYTE